MKFLKQCKSAKKLPYSILSQATVAKIFIMSNIQIAQSQSVEVMKLVHY